MTEDEARTKWCPFTRLIASKDNGKSYGITDAPAGFNRINLPDNDGAVTPSAKCMASDCMAWRSKLTDDFLARATTAYRHDGKRLVAGPTDVIGHCGLAGEPR